MHIRNPIKIVWIFCFLMVCGFASESFALDVTLRYGHTAGTTLTYHLTIETPNPQAHQKVDLDIVRSVTGVDALEVMTVNTSFQNGIVTMNSIPSPLAMHGQVLTSRISRRGEGLETTAIGELADLFAQVGIGTDSVCPDIFRSLGILEFPEGVISEGATWSIDKNHTFPNGESFNINYSYTLEAFVPYGGYECAQIKMEAQSQLSTFQDLPQIRRGVQMNGELRVAGTLLFAHAQGRVVKLDETIETNSVAIIVNYEGRAEVVPVYQKSTITLALQ